MNQQPSKTCPPISELLPKEPCETIDALCQTHGPYTATVYTLFDGVRPVTSRCPQCVAASQAEEVAKRERQERHQRELQVAHLRSNSGIPARFIDRDFAGYRATVAGQRVALSVCRAYADAWPEKLKGGASLVLSGGPGTGKTHLACAVAGMVMQDHLASVTFGSVATLLRFIKDTYRKDSQRSEQDAINDLVRPKLLIVDEVGVQVGSEHEKMLMFEVLNTRYQELRPTILISNLNASELETFIGQRVMDRYRECGSVLAFDWQSFRGQA